MKRRVALLCLLVLGCCMLFVFAAPAAFADMGPKPAVTIEFSNMGSKKMYASLLSLYKSHGPNTAYNQDEEYNFKSARWTTSDGKSHYYSVNDNSNDSDYSPEAEAIWQVFQDYAAQDDYYFLQIWWEFEQGALTTLDWSYYAPRHFKLLIYYPSTGEFLCSEAYDSYAYHSYYTVDLADVDDGLTLVNSYDYFSEILLLVFRIVATVLIELLVALIFRLGSYRQVLTVIFTNVATQGALNLALNLISYFSGGGLMLLLLIIPLEIAVFVAEAVVYSLVFRKEGVPVWKSVLYALVANVVSFFAGIAFRALFVSVT